MLQIIDNSIGEDFVNTLLIRINNKFPYCLARGNGQFFPIQSDTDIIIQRNDYNKFITLLISLQLELNFDIRNIIKRHYVYTHILYLKEFNVFVQIDTEFDFDWWSFRIINAKDILKRSQFSKSIMYASDIDSSFMKFYRSLMWGGKLSKKYKNTKNLFDFEFIDKSTYLTTPLGIKPGKLRNHYSSNVVQRLKETRKSLILTNLINFGLFKTLYRLFTFMFFELRLLFSNNGTILCLNGNKEIIKEVIRNLNEYVKIYNAPYKEILFFKNISQLKKRKLLRDSYLLISDTSSNSDFELLFKNNFFHIKKKGILIEKVKRNNFKINNFINKIYNY